MPLVQLAQDHRFAVLGVYHLNKSRSSDLLLRQEASAALTQITRAGLMLGHDPDDPEGERGGRRVLAVAWSNLSKPAPSIALAIEGKIVELDDGQFDTQPVAVVVGESDLTSGDLLTDHQEDDDRKSALDEAAEFLLTALSDGPKATKALKEAAAGAGISWPSVERAKRKLGTIEARKTGGMGTPWEWSLRDPASKTVKPVDGLTPDGVDGLSNSPVNTGDAAPAEPNAINVLTLTDLGSTAAAEHSRKPHDDQGKDPAELEFRTGAVGPWKFGAR